VKQSTDVSDEFVNASCSASLKKADETLKEECNYNDVGSDKERNDESSFVNGSENVVRMTKRRVVSFEVSRITQNKEENKYTHN
jgi:hypothetical protein